MASSQAQPIRLLHFAEDSDTSGYFPQLARWHDREHYQMFFGTLKPIAPWLRDYMESQGVQCFSCDCRRRLSYPSGLVRLAYFLRTQRIDILHTHLFDPSTIGLLAGWMAGTPVRVMTRHYSDYHTRIHKKWHVRIDQLCNRLSHAIIAVSQHTADHLIEVEKTPSDKVHTILNGIDFDRVRPSAPDARHRIRQEFAVEDAFLLLIVARFHPEKGHDYLFQAIARIKQQTKRRILLLVAGKGPFEESLRNRVRELDCEEQVRFVGFRRDVADLMVAADLVVLPSLAEAFGLVLTEAIYLGTPVIATRVGGIPEIVEEGVDGILVPPANSEILASEMLDLINDPDKLKRLAKVSSERIEKRFRFEDMVRSYEGVYRKLCSSSLGRSEIIVK